MIEVHQPRKVPPIYANIAGTLLNWCRILLVWLVIPLAGLFVLVVQAGLLGMTFENPNAPRWIAKNHVSMSLTAVAIVIELVKFGFRFFSSVYSLRVGAAFNLAAYLVWIAAVFLSHGPEILSLVYKIAIPIILLNVLFQFWLVLRGD